MPYWQQAQTKIHSSTNTQSWSFLNADLQLEVNYPVEVSIYPEQLIYSSSKFTALGRSSYTSQSTAKAVIQSNDGLNWDLVLQCLKQLMDNGQYEHFRIYSTDLFAYGNGKYVALGGSYGGSQYQVRSRKGLYNGQTFQFYGLITDNLVRIMYLGGNR